MKRNFASFVLALTMVTFIAAPATAQTKVARYFVEYHHANSITFHVTLPLTNKGAELVLSIPSRNDPVASRFLVPGVTEVFVTKYQLGLTKKPRTSWGQIRVAVLKVLNQLAKQEGLQPFVATEPEPRDQPCRRRHASQSGNPPTQGVIYKIDCPPNPDMVSLTFNRDLIAGQDSSMLALQPSTVLVERLSSIHGIDEVFARRNYVSLSKGAAFQWDEILPLARSVLCAHLKVNSLNEIVVAENDRPSRTCCGDIHYERTELMYGAFTQVRVGPDPSSYRPLWIVDPSDRRRRGFTYPRLPLP
jgi:hypothetical protein